jgi:hypothetical protein
MVSDPSYRESRVVNARIARTVVRTGSAFALLFVASGAIWRLASIIDGPGIHNEVFAWIAIGALSLSTLAVLVSITLPRSSQFRVTAWMSAVFAWATTSMFLFLECITTGWLIAGPSLPVFAGVTLASMVRLFDVTVEQNALEHGMRPASAGSVTP